MKKLILILCLAILGCTQLKSGGLKLSVDAASFKYDSVSCLYQLYYTLPANVLKYRDSAGLKVGAIRFEVRLEYYLGEINDSWTLPCIATDTLIENGLQYFGVRNLRLQAGDYKVHIHAYDENDTTNFAETHFVTVLQAYDNTHLFISSIELANLIESEDNKSMAWDTMFYKNSLYVIPNPKVEFAGEMPVLKSYNEVYNLKKFAPDGYDVNVSIFDGANREVLAFTRERKTISDAQVEVLDMPINVFATGVYFLRIGITAPHTNPVDSAYTIKKFYVINTQIAPNLDSRFSENELFAKSEFATYNEEDASLELKKALIIASKEEKETVNALNNLDGKKHFLFRFWKLRDPDTTTTINEKLLEFRQQEKFADIHFTAPNVRYGWKSDRGRVLLQYGFPTSRDIHANIDEDKPYEEWFYQNVQGGVYFYFVDISGYGDYTLVHSTAQNEPYNPNWMEDKVKKNNFFYQQENYNRQNGQ